MEAQLKALLNQIYSSPSTPATFVNESRPLSTDEFRMYVYKVVPCTRRGPHSWVECSYCHPGEKASRRDPQTFNYAPIACPNMKADAVCPRGDNCVFAHNVFEYWLHPARFRTQLCSFGVECKRSICFFAHQPGELRVNEYIAQLQALERELEASDPTFASPNAKWGTGGGQDNNNNGNNNSKPFSSEGKAGMMQQQQRNRQHQQQHQLSNAELQQMRQMMNSQANNLSQQAMLNNMGGYGANSGPKPVHANAATAAAALLEAAMQPTTPRLPHQMGLSPGLSPCSSLMSPLGSMSHSQQQHMEGDHLAATMKLLAELSAGKGSSLAPGGAPNHQRLQSVSSVPINMLQGQQNGQHGGSGPGGSSDVQQALHLVSQLQELATRSVANGNGNGDLQSVLMSLLPQLLLQVGGGGHNKGGNGGGGGGGEYSLGASSGLLTPCMSAPLPMLPHQLSPELGPFHNSQHRHNLAPGPAPNSSRASCAPMGSPSPADVLSIGSRKTAGSSYSGSSRSLSPTVSHHSGDGGESRRVSGFADDEPFAMRDSGLSLMRRQSSRQPGSGGLFGREDSLSMMPGMREVPVDGDCMDEMSGASAMIASLTQLVDGGGGGRIGDKQASSSELGLQLGRLSVIA